MRSGTSWYGRGSTAIDPNDRKGQPTSETQVVGSLAGGVRTGGPPPFAGSGQSNWAGTTTQARRDASSRLGAPMGGGAAILIGARATPPNPAGVLDQRADGVHR